MSAIEGIIRFVEQYSNKRIEGFEYFTADEARAELDRLREVEALVPGLVSVLEKCYRELNEIRARDGVPYTFQGIQASVDEEYFSSIVDDCYKLIAEARRVMEAD